MSFFQKLMGGTFESNLAEGNQLFDDGDFGSARLSFERALKKSSQVSEEQIAPVREKISRCRVELARKRLADASDYADGGDLARAFEYLDDALQISETREIQKQVASLKERFEALEARMLAGEEEEMSEDELLAVIAGTWTALQADEYANLPETFHQGLIAGHDGNHEEALKLMQQVLDGTSDRSANRFLHMEIARQHLALEQMEEALAAFGEFAKRLEGEADAVDDLVGAYTQMGHLHLEADRPEEAETCFRQAVAAAPGSHVPPLNLGMFLRSRKEFSDSLQSLEKAKELMGTMHPDMRVIREIGFTYLAMEKKEEAIGYLESVIEHSSRQRAHEQYDPTAAIALTGLYEEKGDLEKACDLFRHLAEGYDVTNHFLYNLQSARLLQQLDASDDLVNRYLVRSMELASSDAERAAIDALHAPEED